jgi:hypothetical protein
MKNNLRTGMLLNFILMAFMLTISQKEAQSQIYEPEGLNMPGNWCGWENPPVNNPAFGNPNQVPNGRLVKITTGQARWQTIISTTMPGLDVGGGTYYFRFTSGPVTGNIWQNMWMNTNVVMNTLQLYTMGFVSDNYIVLEDNKYYTLNWEDQGYVDTRAIFMVTSASPVDITEVSVPADVYENLPTIIDVETSTTPAPEEIVYVRYTTDNWATSAAVVAAMTGNTGEASIPGQPINTVVSYYALTSTISGLTADYDLCTIKFNNNGGPNYSYTIGTAPEPEITWANLQWPGSGAIETGGAFNVYGQAYIEGITGQATPAPGLNAWIGYSTADTDPATWTNWISATYNVPVGNNDEFMADLGAAITSAGTYYYATRFQYNDDPWVYGGFSGGFWDGVNNVSGVLTVTDPIPDPDFNWVNLQFPGSAVIEPGENLDIFAQAYIEGVTGQATPAPGVQAWIGYSNNNTNPATWTNWFPATFNGPSGNNDEYLSNLGQHLTSPGTYYYASRFRLNTGEYFYGGYSEAGGGFWDGTVNISGILTVEALPVPEITWANLQFPGSGEITVGDNFDVFAQVYIEGITGLGSAVPGLQAWIGYSSANTNPAGWNNWVPAAFNAPSGNNDEFMTNIGPEFTESGTWYYAARFSYNGGPFLYGGYNETGGGFWDGTANVSGVLTVNEPQQPTPVLFTLIDGTEIHDNIKFKGDMTNWDTIPMNRDGFTWTVTLDLLPGTYEWGAIEADGTEFGIWLIDGDNLVMSVDEGGAVSGTVTYTTMITNAQTLPYGSRIYPNPANDLLNLEIPGLTAYQLIDLSGRVVMDQPTALGNQRIDLSELESGIYLIKILAGDIVFTSKLVKF